MSFRSGGSSLAQGQTGWLRKRPTFAGHWPNRFVQLSQDGRLSIYTHDFASSQNGADVLVVALYTCIIPQRLAVDPVYEHMVRTTRSGLKSEKVHVIRARFKDRVLFTLGAATAAEAETWRLALVRASTGVEAPEDIPNTEEEEVDEQQPPVVAEETAAAKPTRRRASQASSLVPENWKDNSASVWRVVEEREGMKIEGTSTDNHFPSLRAECEVQGTAQDIFRLVIMDNETGLEGGFTSNRVVKRLNATSDIVYVQTKEIAVGPVQAGPRDLLLLRYWRQEENEDASAASFSEFVITWQSIEDSSLPAELIKSPPGFCRGKIFSMSIHVRALASSSSCRVRIHCHADPGGNMTYATQSMLTTWLTPFVTRILGIESVLDAKYRANAVDSPQLPTFADDDASSPSLVSPSSASLTSSSPTGEGEEQEELKCGSWRFEEWMQTPADEPFQVRGKNYLVDRIKQPSQQHKFILVAADLSKCEGGAPVPHCAARSDSPLGAIQQRYPGRQVFVMQFIMPGPPFYILCMYAVAREGVCEEDSPFARLWHNFVEGTDEYRNTVFKMIPRVTKGSFIVKKTVGQVPAILGSKVKLDYYTGVNYIEVDVDLNTSAVAGSILSVVKGYATTFTADLTLLLEGHSEDELPEEILVGFRMIKPHLSKAVPLGVDPNPELTKQRMEIAAKSRMGELKKDGKSFA